MKVLVIGAERFVGRSACVGLRARKHDVCALAADAFPDAIRARLESASVHLAAGSAKDEATVTDAARGCDAVVHAVWWPDTLHASLAKHNDETLIPAETTLAACTKAGVPHLVFVSSDLVTAGQPRKYADESLPHSPSFVGPFAEAMALAEALVQAANGRDGFATTVLRPGQIWGPDDDEWLPGLLAQARSRSLVLFGDGRALIPTTYIDNLVDVMARALERRHAAGGLYFVTDDERITAKAFLTRVVVSAGGSAPRRRVPYSLAYASAWLAEAFGADPAHPRAEVVRFGQTAQFNLKRVREDLEYDPVRIDVGMAALRSWSASK